MYGGGNAEVVGSGGSGSAILVKSPTGHSLFFRPSFKHEDRIEYLMLIFIFTPTFSLFPPAPLTADLKMNVIQLNRSLGGLRHSD